MGRMSFGDFRRFIADSSQGADTREGVRSKPLMGGGVPPPETARTGGEAGPDGRRRPSPPPINVICDSASNQ